MLFKHGGKHKRTSFPSDFLSLFFSSNKSANQTKPNGLQFSVFMVGLAPSINCKKAQKVLALRSLQIIWLKASICKLLCFTNSLDLQICININGEESILKLFLG